MNWRRWSHKLLRDWQIRFNRDDGHVSSLYVYVYRIYVKYTYPRRRATLWCRSVRPHDRFLFRISVVSHGTHMCKRAPLPSQHISRHTLHFVFNVTSHSSPNRSQWVPSDRAWWSDILISHQGGLVRTSTSEDWFFSENQIHILIMKFETIIMSKGCMKSVRKIRIFSELFMTMMSSKIYFTWNFYSFL